MLLKITVDAAKLIVEDENHGGCRAGQCVLCDQCGWLTEHPLGLPHGRVGNGIHHTKECQLGQALTKVKPPKCAHCKQPQSEHKAQTFHCPGGRKHRVHGWPWFDPARTFTPKVGDGEK